MAEHNEKGKSEAEQVKEHLCFEDGVVETIDRVQALLMDREVVVIGLDGSDTDVGKSTLLSELSIRIDALRIPVTVTSEIRNIPDAFSQIPTKQSVYNSRKCVIIIEHTGVQLYLTDRAIAMVKKSRGKELGQTLKYLGIDKSEVDLFVSIYAPWKKFLHMNESGYRPLGDVVICNEKAADKPRTGM